MTKFGIPEWNLHGEAISSVKLERGPCFGSCPVYAIELQRSGTATWHGELYVDRICEFIGEIDAHDFDALCGYIDRAGFYHWSDN